jgi:hypothetical protein
MTFTLGLACVWFINGSQHGLIEVPVNIPHTKSGEVIVVFPKSKSEIPCCTGASGGGYRNEDRHHSSLYHRRQIVLEVG